MAAPKGNKFAQGLTTSGRPAHYDTSAELKEKCEEYFEQETKYTITGLALFLGFSSRSSFDDYSKKSDEFSYIIKRAKLVVEQGYEEMFHNGSNAGIFPLKNMGWKDKTEVENKNFNYNSKELTKDEMKEYNDNLEEEY